MTVLTPADERWSDTFLRRTQPEAGEWLGGYMLRVDARNDFPAGEAIRATRRHGAGLSHMGRMGGLVLGRAVDLSLLATLAGAVDSMAVEALTVAPIVRWLFEHRRGAHLESQHAGAYRICPQCIADQHVPFSATVAEVPGCIKHQIRFADRCSCGEPLLFFGDQVPFTCHAPGCGRPYAGLLSDALRADERVEARAWTEAYESLRAFSRAAHAPLTRTELARGLRFLFHRAGRNVSDDLILFQSLAGRRDTSLRVVARVLRLAGASAADLDLAARDGGPSRPTGTTAKGFPRCPVPSCPDPARVQRRSRPSGGRETYYSCPSCGARFTERRVCFAFDPAPTYPQWRVVKNRRLLVLYAERVRRACRELTRRGTPLGKRRVLRAAQVPQSLAYLTPRAGLCAQIAAAADQADLQCGETP